ncbi:hypothetical protein M885DRAFT_504451 [Pelagophyceae sp. CCMP2097]|nr:hypothetical protein M885DRAFT_504451 [Pelagophyceae sp. CCMP2097]
MRLAARALLLGLATLGEHWALQQSAGGLRRSVPRRGRVGGPAPLCAKAPRHDVDAYCARTQEALGMGDLLGELRARAATSRARRLFGDLAPNAKAAERRYEAIVELARCTFPPPVRASGMSAMDEDLEASLVRCVRDGATLELDELVRVRDAGCELLELRAWVAGEDTAKGRAPPEELGRLLSALKAPSVLLEDALCEPLPTAIEDHPEEGMRLSDVAFPELADARRKERAAKRALDAAKKSVMDAAKLSFADSAGFFEYEGRPVVAIKASDSAAAGLVHGASRTGQTKYVEPHAVTAPTNNLRAASSSRRAEEAAALRLLSNAVRANAGALETCLDAAAALDAVVARDSLGRDLRGVVPIVGSEGVIDAHDVRHAVLQLGEDEECVGNDVSLARDGVRCLVISGANAGGKTVLMKAVGLLALCVRLGVPTPCAAGGRIDFFDPILAHIGDAQALDGGVSTYVGHLRLVRTALQAAADAAAARECDAPDDGDGAVAKQQPLVLLDELGSGTDPLQGAALAQASLEALVGDGAICVATTHHSPIKALAVSNDFFEIAAMVRDEVTGEATFKCQLGVAGESRALVAARGEALPAFVVDRAEELLGDDRKQLEELSRVLTRKVGEADAREIAAARAEEGAAATIAEAQAQAKETQQRFSAAEAALAQAYAAKVANFESQLAAFTAAMNSKNPLANPLSAPRAAAKNTVASPDGPTDGLAAALAAERQRAADDAKDKRASSRNLAPLTDIDSIQTGARVVVLKEGAWYGRAAVVVSLAKKNVQVELEGFDATLVGPLRLKPAELAYATEDSIITEVRRRPPPPPQGALPPNISKRVAATMMAELPKMATAFAERKADDDVTARMRTTQNTLDCRGSNLEDASENLNTFLGQCRAKGLTTVYVLHGHGTGVLKNGLRQMLKRHAAAKTVRPAEAGDGGDAFTVVQLRP